MSNGSTVTAYLQPSAAEAEVPHGPDSTEVLPAMLSHTYQGVTWRVDLDQLAKHFQETISGPYETMYPGQDNLADYSLVQVPRNMSWIAFFYHLPKFFADDSTMRDRRAALHYAFCRFLAWTSPTVTAPQLGDETLGMLFSNILLLQHHYVAATAANNRFQTVYLCNQWLAHSAKHRSALKPKFEQLKKDPTSSERLNQWFGALVLLFSRFSTQGALPDLSHGLLTHALVYDSPPWTLASRVPTITKPAAEAPTPAVTEGAASSSSAVVFRCLFKFSTSDLLPLEVSPHTQTVDALITTINDRIRTDALWRECAQREFTAPQELSGLRISGRVYVPQQTGAAPLLGDAGLKDTDTVYLSLRPSSPGPAEMAQLLYAMFPSKDRKALVVSFTTMTFERLITLISGKILADAPWTELAQKDAAAPQDFRGLMFAGQWFAPRGPNGAQFLSAAGLSVECTITVFMKPRHDNSASPELPSATSPAPPSSTAIVNRDVHSTPVELPRGPPMNDSLGAPLLDSKDDLVGTTDPRDKEIMARLNPYASEEEAAVRFNNADGYVTAEHDPWTFYVQMDTDDANTACHLVQLQVEDTDDDEAEVEPTPLLAVRSASATAAQPYQYGIGGSGYGSKLYIAASSRGRPCVGGTSSTARVAAVLMLPMKGARMPEPPSSASNASWRARWWACSDSRKACQSTWAAAWSLLLR